MSAPEKTSPAPEECIAAQSGGGFFAAIGMNSFIHIQETKGLHFYYYIADGAFHEYEKRLILHASKQLLLSIAGNPILNRPKMDHLPNYLQSLDPDLLHAGTDLQIGAIPGGVSRA
jgi:hypothetical protein